MTELPPRAQCPVCHHSVRLTQAGTLADHATPRTIIAGQTRCTGSGRKPPR